MRGEAMLIAADGIRLKGTLFDGLERHFFGSLSGLVFSGVELAKDSDVGVLIEAGIRLHARFRFGITFDNGEIMMPEAKSPFEGFTGIGMFEVVRHSLSQFDDIAVGFAGFRIMFREMVGI